MAGQFPEFRQLGTGERPYPMDWNNISPSVGFAWTPSAKTGFLQRLTWPDRRHRGPRWLQPLVHATRPGRLHRRDRQQPRRRAQGLSEAPARESRGSPLLMRDPSRLGPAAFPATPLFPLPRRRHRRHHDLQPGSCSAVCRHVAGRRAAVVRPHDVDRRPLPRARSAGNWRTNNYNELNIIENGFLDEFKLAMANLQANIAAADACRTFAYFGPGGHRHGAASDLPGLLYRSAACECRGPGAVYLGKFPQHHVVTPLARFNPNPYASADALTTT